MYSPTLVPCNNIDKRDSKSATATQSTPPQLLHSSPPLLPSSNSPSLHPSNPPSPLGSSDSTLVVALCPKDADETITTIMPPLVTWTVKSLGHSRLRLSRLERSREEIESLSIPTKRLPLEEKEQHTVPSSNLHSSCAKTRAVATNHDSQKRRKESDDETSIPVQPVLLRDDTSPRRNSETEQSEMIPTYSSSHVRSGLNSRMTPQIVNGSSDGDQPSRHPPMKNANSGMLTKSASKSNSFIRISPSPQTQTNNAEAASLSTKKTSTEPVKKHITQNNTAGKRNILCSSTTGNNKEDTNLSSVVVLRDFIGGNVIANSSTTESALVPPTLTPSSSSSSVETKTENETRLALKKDGPPASKTMEAVDKQGKRPLPSIRQQQLPLQQESAPSKSLNNNTDIAPSPTQKNSIVSSLTSEKGPHLKLQSDNQSLSSTIKDAIVVHPTPPVTQAQKVETIRPLKPEVSATKQASSGELPSALPSKLESKPVSSSTKKEAIGPSDKQSIPSRLIPLAGKPSPTMCPALPAKSIHSAGANKADRSSMSSPSSVAPQPTTSNNFQSKKNLKTGHPSTPGSKKRKRSGSDSTASTSSKPKGQSSGRWTADEHQAFLEGLAECGREWKKVAQRIPTRSSAQIRSHAQKYFAKLQRDQETSAATTAVNAVSGSLIQGDLAAAAANCASTTSFLMTGVPLASGGSLVVVGEGGRLSGTIVTGPAALPPSVQRNVERIVANPRAAQREVEDTMEALRRRYRQLQQRLEERRKQRDEKRKRRQQQQSTQQQPSVLSSNATESTDDSSSTIASSHQLPQARQTTTTPSEQQSRSPKQPCNPCRKRALNLPMNRNQPNSKRSNGRSSSPPTGDENSSVSSNVSSIAASRTDLGNEEIVALEVLGEALPRGDSVNDLQVLDSRDPFVALRDDTVPSAPEVPIVLGIHQSLVPNSDGNSTKHHQVDPGLKTTK